MTLSHKHTNANAPGYILNPVTSRWVKKSGRTGQFIVEFWKICKKSPADRKKKVLTPAQHKAKAARAAAANVAGAKIKTGAFSTVFQDKVSEMEKRYGIANADFGFRQKKRLSPIFKIEPIISTLVQLF